MGTIIGVTVIILLLGGLILRMVQIIGKQVQAMQGHNRCVDCKSRLKSTNGRYAYTCAHCGRKQPWATA